MGRALLNVFKNKLYALFGDCKGLIPLIAKETTPLLRGLLRRREGVILCGHGVYIQG